jgi:hypothetical protein
MAVLAARCERNGIVGKLSDIIAGKAPRIEGEAVGYVVISTYYMKDRMREPVIGPRRTIYRPEIGWCPDAVYSTRWFLIA